MHRSTSGFDISAIDGRHMWCQQRPEQDAQKSDVSCSRESNTAFYSFEDIFNRSKQADDKSVSEVGDVELDEGMQQYGQLVAAGRAGHA